MKLNDEIKPKQKNGADARTLEIYKSQILRKIPAEISVVIHAIKEGYPIEKFETLKDEFGVNKETLAKVANISLATMHRRKNASGRLTADESEKIYRLEKLFNIALEVIESKESVQAWFNASQVVFEGRTPLEYADTLPGAEEVERVLRRMEHGIVL